METKTCCWKLYYTKATLSAQQFKSEKIGDSRLTLYIKQHRLPTNKITRISFSYSPLTEKHVVKRLEGLGRVNIETPIVAVCNFTEERKHSVIYDEAVYDSKNIQVGSVYIPKTILHTPYPKAIKVFIEWIYSSDK